MRFGDDWLCWGRKSYRGGAAAVPQAGPWDDTFFWNPAAGLSKQVSVVIRAGEAKSIVFFEFSVLV